MLSIYFGIGAFSLWVGVRKRSHSCQWSLFHSHQDSAASSRSYARTSQAQLRWQHSLPHTAMNPTSCRLLMKPLRSPTGWESQHPLPSCSTPDILTFSGSHPPTSSTFFSYPSQCTGLQCPPSDLLLLDMLFCNRSGTARRCFDTTIFWEHFLTIPQGNVMLSPH